MTRIAPLAENDWTDEQKELLGPMRNNQGVGRIARNLFTTLVRHPKLFKRWTVFANHVLFKSTLSPKLRELAILRIAWLTQADYEWGQHVLIAQEAGLSEEDIRRVKVGHTASDWTPAQAALLQAVDQLHHDTCIDDDCWASLQPHFNEQQLYDLIFAVGNYRMLASFMHCVGVVRDEGVPSLQQP